MRSTTFVEAVTKPDRAAWLELAGAYQGATFFHTPYWQQLATECDPGTTDYTLQFALQGEIKVIVPLVKMGHRLRGTLKRCISTFGTCYGGALSRELLSQDALWAIQENVMRRCSTLTLVGNPFGQRSAWHPRLQLTSLSTQVLDLPEQFEDLLKGFSKGHRAAYTKARREGVRVRRAQSATDVEAYFGLYTQALKRWGSRSRPYPRSFFHSIARMGEQHPELTQLWLAERDGLILAGAVLFYWKGHADYWHGATHEEHHTTDATTFLLGEVIRDACERGLTHFDFNPSGGHPNVAAFKRRFGAREVLFERADYTHRVLRMYDRLRSRNFFV